MKPQDSRFIDPNKVYEMSQLDTTVHLKERG